MIDWFRRIIQNEIKRNSFRSEELRKKVEWEKFETRWKPFCRRGQIETYWEEDKTNWIHPYTERTRYVQCECPLCKARGYTNKSNLYDFYF